MQKEKVQLVELMTNPKVLEGVIHLLTEGVVRTLHIPQKIGVCGMNCNSKLIVGGVDSTLQRVNLLDQEIYH